jgi:hypothetical protein
MRTSIILDDELAVRLRAEATRSGKSLSAFLAEAGRAALHTSAGQKAPPFKLIVERGTGVQPGIHLDSTSQILADEDSLR